MNVSENDIKSFRKKISWLVLAVKVLNIYEYEFYEQLSKPISLADFS